MMHKIFIPSLLLLLLTGCSHSQPSLKARDARDDASREEVTAVAREPLNNGHSEVDASINNGYSEVDALLRNRKYREVVDRMTAILSQNPDDDKALARRGIAHAKIGHAYYALNDFIKAKEINPSTRNQMNLGNALYQFGHCERASVAFKDIIEQEPSNYQAMTNLGAAYSCYGERQLALTWLNKALDINPNNEIALTHIAYIHFVLNELPQAEKAINKALIINQGYPIAHKIAASIYTKLKQSNTGQEHFNAYQRLCPGIHDINL